MKTLFVSLSALAMAFSGSPSLLASEPVPSVPVQSEAASMPVLCSGSDDEKIRQIEGTFPLYSYWNHSEGEPYSLDSTTDHPCKDHATVYGDTAPLGDKVCNSFNGLTQDEGFAQLCYYKFHGFNASDQNFSQLIDGESDIKVGDIVYIKDGCSSCYWVFVTDDYGRGNFRGLSCNGTQPCFIGYETAYTSQIKKRITPIKTTAPVQVTVPAGQIATYRLYNKSSGEHFYTQDENERNTLISRGWKDEALAWASSYSKENPVYRLCNPNSGDHHYTKDAAEKDALVKAGWQYEGICWYSEPDGGKSLHRLYNPNAKTGSHHYTTDTAEKDALVKMGWKYEGIAWNVL